MRRVFVLVAALCFVSCGESSKVQVTKRSMLVAGVVPAANPDTNEATPAELNNTRVIRYRIEGVDEVDAIVLAIPGFLGGAQSFDGLARSVVRLGAESGTSIEVWAIDRRSNLMEDLTGMNAAEREQDPEIATRYYTENAEVDGKTFAGFRGQADVSFISEWGLETHIEDFRRIVDLVPQASQKGHVFLMGHSLGGSLTELYAAWRFTSDDQRGFDQLAGLIMVDGVLGDTPTSQVDYETDVNGIRSGDSDRYANLLGLGTTVFSQAEISSLRVHFDPEGIVEDAARDSILALLTTATIPKLTNAAALGLAFDGEYEPLSFVRTSIGRLQGGPVETYTHPIFMAEFTRPSDPDATYGWTDALDTDPPEYTPIENLARAFTIGESNFAEWYFPERIGADVGAAAGANIDENGWQVAHGIRAFDGKLIDAPVLCIPAGSVERCNSIVDRVAPTVGEGRPQQGATRTMDEGFKVIDVTFMVHLDPILSDDSVPTNPVPQALLEFIQMHTMAGRIPVPQ